MLKEVVLPHNYNYMCAFLTLRCNLSCSFCLNAFEDNFDRKKYNEISGDQWIESLNRIKSRPEVPVTFSGGEAFLHKDFIKIINGLKPDLNIDILTNLHWGKRGLERFIEKVDPKRINRKSPYAQIRVSYHPTEMDAEKLVTSAKKMKDAGFNIGIWSVLYPSPEQLSAINEMQFRCLDAGIEYRLKEFVGIHRGERFGNYKKYPDASFHSELKECLCKTSELLIGPAGDVFRCHRDLYADEFRMGNITSDNFYIDNSFRRCTKYGECHPCDVKEKTNYKQELGHTSVEIKNIGKTVSLKVR